MPRSRGRRSRASGATVEVAQALEEAGLKSPRAIVESGREALAALPAVGDLADKIYSAARGLGGGPRRT